VQEPVEGGAKVQLLEVAPETKESLRHHWYVYGEVPPETVAVNCFD
jgi:hypothetical protein